VEFIKTMRDDIRKAAQDTNDAETMNPGVKDASILLSAHGEIAQLAHGETLHVETTLVAHGETSETHEETAHGETMSAHGETWYGKTPEIHEKTAHAGETTSAHGEATETHESTTHAETTSVPQLHPSDLVDQTSSTKEQEDGWRFRERIANAIEQQENEHAKESKPFKIRVRLRGKFVCCCLQCCCVSLPIRKGEWGKGNGERGIVMFIREQSQSYIIKALYF
jgi:hypothetical protein